MKDLRQGIQKSLGPGILLAGACIGGSHLMSSTTAGAKFGFSLIGLILLTNLIKYPFLLVGTRFTAVSGLSLLEGFKARSKLYLPLYLTVSLITGTFTIAAVSFVSGLLLTNIPLLSLSPPIDLSIGVLIISGLILLIGQYKALDRISKFLVILLTILTGFALISLLISGSIDSVVINLYDSNPSPWRLENLSFLIPLMGWMPGPVELCVWPSLWMFSKENDTKHKASIEEAEFDFNLGYLITVITAIFFVSLGALTMYGSGETMMSGSGVSFAQNLIRLYTEAIGGWAKWIIVPASFAAMFSTTLTCLDAYPRSISAIQGLLQAKDRGITSSSKEKKRLKLWIVLHVLASIFSLLIAKTGGITIKDFVFGAMSGSFLTAPLFAWMAMDTINSSLISKKYRYGRLMKGLCWFGLIFLSGFSLLFIANSFFGFGIIK
ncbi:NRAMP family divalent metal transporter [Prochlorococcus marinus]|uniref:NRAMP family divalent metal transporter n=1 Tax=Prochlorococcus marinus TaxID=1219 RepID=UPI0022B46FA2|nr:divalent metal cation transporter [Prochlorococcus marinus]